MATAKATPHSSPQTALILPRPGYPPSSSTGRRPNHQDGHRQSHPSLRLRPDNQTPPPRQPTTTDEKLNKNQHKTNRIPSHPFHLRSCLKTTAAAAHQPKHHQKHRSWSKKTYQTTAATGTLAVKHNRSPQEDDRREPTGRRTTTSRLTPLSR